MKMSLLVVSMIGTGFFALSTPSPATPFGGGIHIRSVQRGRTFNSVGAHRVFMGQARNNRRFFRNQRRRFFPAFNLFSFGFPLWYPNYYCLSPDDDSGNDNPPYQPGYDDQYWGDLALRQQSELAARQQSELIAWQQSELAARQQSELTARQQSELGPRPKDNGPIAAVPKSGNSEPMEANYDRSPYGSNGVGEPDQSTMLGPNEPNEVPADSLTLAPWSDPVTQDGVFDNLVLVSWLNDAGKDVIFVKNTETGDVQRITSEPNLDRFRIVAIHPNPDPKSFEAVISNGKEQGAVRFHFAARVVARP
jgi:hypothetical protein